VSALDDVRRQDVVGGQRPVAQRVFDQQRQERLEVVLAGALPHLNHHAQGRFLQGFLDLGRFMIGANPGGDIADQGLAPQSRRVAVDRRRPSAGCQDLGQDRRAAVQHGGEIHYLGQSQYARQLQQLLYGGRVEHGAGILRTGRRHARRGHEEDVQRQPLAGRQHHLDAGNPQHVGDLVRIGDDGRSAVRHQRAGQLRRPQQGAFQVHVGVDQSGDNRLAVQGDRLSRLPVVRSDARDPTVGNDHVSRFDLAREDVDDPPAAQQQIARFEPASHSDSPLQ